MGDLKCLGCQQVFDERKLLFDHLQKNTSHKRAKKASKNTSSRAQSQRPKQLHTEPKGYVSSTLKNASIQTCAMSLKQPSGNGPSWLCLTAEQESYLRKVVPGQCHPLEALQSSQYHLNNRTRAQLEQLQTCLNCNRRRNNPKTLNQVCVFHVDRRKAQGKRSSRARTCCTFNSRGCQTLPEHVYPPIVYDDFETSSNKSTAHANGQRTSKQFAMVLDCEMVAVEGGTSELAQLCAVDLMTAEVLVNSLVQPTRRVINWRTKYSGIKASDMILAVQSSRALRGWEAAQMELLKYIDSDTVLIGHALQHDLKALHLIHHRVMDTSIMTRLAVSQQCTRNWSLKTLCAELTNREIQNHGAEGHDCLEDTLATRDVFLRCILQPEELQRWAAKRLVEVQVKELERRMAKLLRAEGSLSSTVDRNVWYDEGEEYYESEVLYWSEIAEDLGWPHPDTGYDPWSD